MMIHMSFIKILSTFELRLLSTDYWALLFIGCLSLFVPLLWATFPVYLLFKAKRRSSDPVKGQKKSFYTLSDVVLFIQRNHLNALSNAIESNPDILYCEYKNQNLLMWCKHYNNSQAQSVILQMTKKYPKPELLSA